MKKSKPLFFIKQINKVYNTLSHPYSFLFVLLSIIAWFGIGIPMHFSEEWYKIMHIVEMSISILMIFIIESTQHADDKAMQEKLDEIIKKLPQTDNKFIGIEKKYKGQEQKK